MVKYQRNKSILKRKRKEPPSSKNFAEQFELVDDVYEILEKSVQSLQGIVSDCSGEYHSLCQYISESITYFNSAMGYAEDFFEVSWDNVEYNDIPGFGDFEPFVASVSKAVFPYTDIIDGDVAQIVRRCKEVFKDLNKACESIREYYYNQRFFDDSHQNYAGLIMYEIEDGLQLLSKAVCTIIQ